MTAIMEGPTIPLLPTIDRAMSWSTSFIPKSRVDSRRDTVLFEYDRQRNDDYFPQGEEYEDDIGADYGQLSKELPGRRIPREEDMEHFAPPALLSETGNSRTNPPPAVLQEAFL